jgi:hypothetical protein
VLLDCRRFQHDAIRHKLVAGLVMGASACCVVKQSARYPGQRDIAAVFVFQLVQAAFSTPIAKRFPLCL